MIVDTAGAVTNSTLTVSNPGTVVNTVGTLGVASVANEGDLLTGSLTLTEGIDAKATQTTYSFTGQTLAEIAASFNAPNGANFGLGITAALNTGNVTIGNTTYAANTLLEFSASSTDPVGALGASNVAVSGNSISDVTPASFKNQTVVAGTLLDTITVANAADYVTGDLHTVSGEGANTATFTAITAGQTLQNIADDFNGVTTDAGATQTGAFDVLGITATLNAAGTALTFTQTLGDSGPLGAAGVAGFFQGVNSWGANFSTMLTNSGTTSSAGILKLAQTSNSNIESTLNADISKEESLISAQQKSLTTELNSANEIMQQIPSQLQGVNELYSAITGYNQNLNG